MTTTINAALLKALINDSSVTDASAELIIDHAINKLNLFGAELPNLGGAAGSKTRNYTSEQTGAIIDVAIVVYSTNYKTSGGSSSSISLGGLSLSDSSSSNNQQINDAAKEAARMLMEYDWGRSII